MNCEACTSCLPPHRPDLMKFMERLYNEPTIRCERTCRYCKGMIQRRSIVFWRWQHVR